MEKTAAIQEHHKEAIDKAIQNPSMLDSLLLFDIISVFEQELGPTGWLYIDPVTQKITPKMQAIDHTREWAFVNPNPEMFCNFYQAVFYGTLGHPIKIIPQRCLDCYKVVVKMHTVVDLWKLYNFQGNFISGFEGKDRFCKCGIEQRDWVHYRYGGYFYNHGLEQGLQRHKEVYAGLRTVFGDKAVSARPGSWSDGKIEVILKRGCTEYEVKLGPSDKWEMTPEKQALHDKIFANCDLKKSGIRPPDFVFEHVFSRWLRFAWASGDPTAKFFNANQPFYTPVVTYHDKKEIKTNG